MTAKVPEITGGAIGFGEATVRRFAGISFRVVICDIEAERGKAVAEEINAAHGICDFFPLDVAVEA